MMTNSRRPATPGRGGQRRRGTSAPGSGADRRSGTRRRQDAGGRTVRTKEPRQEQDGLEEQSVPDTGLSLAARAMIFGAVIFLIVLMVAPSLNVYFDQRSRLQELQQQEADTKSSIAALNDETQRWKDQDFVRTQARSRLGWVKPGEVGYRVIGDDGEVIGTSDQVAGLSANRPKPTPTVWWKSLSQSVTTVDHPPKAKKDEGAVPRASSTPLPGNRGSAAASSTARPTPHASSGPR
ncbi:MAG: septum formation initiator family protein [Cutibacterium granulosum]|uniref:Septum formation initiator n=2 Tax=Cutibacterium granulosum TaxID=33011 RepID=U1EU34_9ACTN|nr:septum formation initiator family protein [Cutibacterium granulosum]ERF55217.1 septum formation initiator [Cutibacterium granulosum DSM 20700]ERF63992.1 putative septum formation initiator [Cutibacterium granulosum TM11]KAG9060551.1 septum formation initiator family protein [Cutibacterium granulosum DSM 20700]MDU3768560.1 septum formation initiator family protein [Cutibacterium granulosum]